MTLPLIWSRFKPPRLCLFHGDRYHQSPTPTVHSNTISVTQSGQCMHYPGNFEPPASSRPRIKHRPVQDTHAQMTHDKASRQPGSDGGPQVPPANREICGFTANTTLRSIRRRRLSINVDDSSIR
ncbi:hypothetical protein BGZ61DRAFT_451290 [Ilyonectria robusta]|uniref:uncharacterized protein n=1 Tax=Ilyonectria robusta TaxID=1079257 RepID=UPI001E8DD016|nr:uncharacterized protein BGZ61DRAFT_451290 [Ilyonectria robusta]KAH8699772.1 hypothetical protein BGZ61DRAFT_451290 [Ilyonectria robusta]